MTAPNPFAFPSTNTVTTAAGIKLEDHRPGMSLRDYFAGQALAGRLADGKTPTPEAVAEQCYTYADAMLRARERAPAEPFSASKPPRAAHRCEEECCLPK